MPYAENDAGDRAMGELGHEPMRTQINQTTLVPTGTSSFHLKPQETSSSPFSIHDPPPLSPKPCPGVLSGLISPRLPQITPIEPHFDVVLPPPASAQCSLAPSLALSLAPPQPSVLPRSPLSCSPAPLRTMLSPTLPSPASRSAGRVCPLRSRPSCGCSSVTV